RCAAAAARPGRSSRAAGAGAAVRARRRAGAPATRSERIGVGAWSCVEGVPAGILQGGHAALDAVEMAEHGGELLVAEVLQHRGLALGEFGADLAHAALAGLGEVDASRARIDLVTAPLDQALPGMDVEHAHEAGTVDPDQRGEVLLGDAA